MTGFYTCTACSEFLIWRQFAPRAFQQTYPNRNALAAIPLPPSRVIDYLTGAFVGVDAREAQTSSLSLRAKTRWPE